MKDPSFIITDTEPSLINDFPAMVFIIDLGLRNIQWCNTTMEESLGYLLVDMQQIGDIIFKTLLHPDDYSNLLGAEKLFLDGAYQYIGVCRLQNRNKEGWRWFWSYACIREKDQDGKVKTLLCFLLEFPSKISTPKQVSIALHDLLYSCNKFVWQDLNKRQITILKLLKEGYKAPTIAKKLLISTATVKLELQKLFEKFHVHTTTALIATLIEMGL